MSDYTCPVCHCTFQKSQEPDPCLGLLPSPVVAACCGHGNVDHAIVVFGDPPNRTALRGSEALDYFADS